MTLPSTGSVSISQVATELGISQTGLSLNDARVRALAGVLSGPISFSNLRGKTKLSVTANSVLATRGTNNTGPISGSSTATPVGGTAPYTYSWVFVSGTSFTLANGTTATATFSRSVAPNDVWSAIYRVTLTDILGLTAMANISVNLNGFQV